MPPCWHVWPSEQTSSSQSWFCPLLSLRASVSHSHRGVVSRYITQWPRPLQSYCAHVSAVRAYWIFDIARRQITHYMYMTLYIYKKWFQKIRMTECTCILLINNLQFLQTHADAIAHLFHSRRPSSRWHMRRLAQWYWSTGSLVQCTCHHSGKLFQHRHQFQVRWRHRHPSVQRRSYHSTRKFL